jgi:NADH dehydrogenase FAD-containing subunit
MSEAHEANTYDVVVLGAGYAGMMAALRLHGRKRGPKRIALVSQSDAFVERVRLQEGILAAVGLRIPSIARMVAGTNIEFVRARVEALDADAGQVWLAGADGPRTLVFERAVFALGSHIDVNRVNGVAEHAHRLDPGDGPYSVAALRTALHQAGDRRPSRVVVVGGGETGVEVAGEIKAQWPKTHVTMLSQSRCCDFKGPRVEQAIRAVLEGLGVELRDHVVVREVRADAVVLADGEVLPCDLCVWSGGLAGSPVARAAGLTIDAQQRIWVDPMLRALSHPRIFAVGDAAHPMAPTGAPYRMSAFVALNSGAYVADAILDDLAGRRPRPFAFSTYGQGVAIGRVGVGFSTYPDDKPILSLVTGRAGIHVRNFFVWLLVQFLKLERRFPGFYFIAGRRRVSWNRAEAAMRNATAETSLPVS